MAPVPHPKKKSLQPVQQRYVSTTHVIDEIGRNLSQLLKTQSKTDKKQNKNITITSQHAKRGESDKNSNTITFRDVFPGRKYILTLSSTSWMGDENVVEIGYTVDDEYNLLETFDEAPEDGFSIDLTELDGIDTLDVKLVGAEGTIRGYLEDETESSGLLDKIKEIVEKVAEIISDQGKLKRDIEDLQEQCEDLDERVTALEEEEEPSNHGQEENDPLVPSEP